VYWRQIVVTPYQLVDEAVCSALQGQVETTQRLLEAAREMVSFLRIKELVLEIINRLTNVGEQLKVFAVMHKVDQALIDRGIFM
jgi:hypothetical protein